MDASRRNFLSDYQYIQECPKLISFQNHFIHLTYFFQYTKNEIEELKVKKQEMWAEVLGNLNSSSNCVRTKELYSICRMESHDEGEASLNAFTPASSPNSGGVISFMYSRPLLWTYSFAACSCTRFAMFIFLIFFFFLSCFSLGFAFEYFIPHIFIGYQNFPPHIFFVVRIGTYNTHALAYAAASQRPFQRFILFSYFNLNSSG